MIHLVGDGASKRSEESHRVITSFLGAKCVRTAEFRVPTKLDHVKKHAKSFNLESTIGSPDTHIVMARALHRHGLKEIIEGRQGECSIFYLALADTFAQATDGYNEVLQESIGPSESDSEDTSADAQGAGQKVQRRGTWK